MIHQTYCIIDNTDTEEKRIRHIGRQDRFGHRKKKNGQQRTTDIILRSDSEYYSNANEPQLAQHANQLLKLVPQIRF
jgi:hypothetical protein